jgi:hypothetical protein
LILKERHMRALRAIGLLSALIAALVPGSVFAATTADGNPATGVLDLFLAGMIVTDDSFATQDLSAVMTDPGTYHSPGFPSDTTDSSFCGPDWASDHVTRHFTVRPLGPGMWDVVEQFKDGSFVAPIAPLTPEPSPGCISGDGGMITGSVTGTFHGYLDMTITASSFNPTAADNGCPPAGGCFFTDDWLTVAFGVHGRIDNAFFFHYVAATGQQLAVNEWKNASCNRGGNSGDIATIATSRPGTYGCP